MVLRRRASRDRAPLIIIIIIIIIIEKKKNYSFKTLFPIPVDLKSI